ncbi:MAG: DNA polymerase-1 [Alteromonas naphthalenivorans]|jgi:DNA polymerase-1
MDINSKNTLFLIDGSSFLYRAYYGLRPMHTHDGQPVQAVYGFCRMIKKLIDQFGPEHMVLVWDSKGKTERHEIFPEYKATRQAPPSDLFEQKEHIVEFAKAIGLHQLAQVGIEADDLMYSLAKEWEAVDKNVLVITSDKDMGQMLNGNITMFDTFKDLFITPGVFEEKLGFAPKKASFYFSLLGDASDNIPGVKGIGKKGALELVSEFKSLEDLYDNLENVTVNRLRNALEKSKDNAFLSEELFLLRKHSLEYTYENLQFDPTGWSGARGLFEALGFKSLLRGMAQAGSPVRKVKTSQERGYQFICVNTQELLDRVVAEAKEAKLFAYDTEGVGTNAVDLNMIGLSICTQVGISYYIPFGHNEGLQLDREYVLEKLKPIFEDSDIKKIAHHTKFDQMVMSQHGIKEQGMIFDTILAANLVKNEWQKNALKEISFHYLDEAMWTFKEIVNKRGRKDFAEVPIDEATEYAAADSHQTFKLYFVLKPLLKEKNSEKIFYNIEMPLLDVLVDMELRGIYCDASVLKELDITVTKQLEEIYRTATSLLDPQFEKINFSSSKQVAHLLFDYLKLPPKRKNAKGDGYSTDNAVLMELAKEHPIPSYIIQYRELFKLKTTYIDALPEYIDKKSGRIHTDYSQIRVATGRLSSSNPNLQNIPVDGLGSTVRMAFKPQGDNVFLSADYSQIELRVLAHLSQDPNLLQAFKNGHDIHAETAAKIFDIPLGKVTTRERSVGKRINFSILYGLTPYGLSKDLDIPVGDAKKYIDAYFAQYPKVRQWMDSVIEQGKENGYVTTVFRRRRPVPGLKERNKNLYDLACRIAVNTVAQGTAAEIMKMGMLKVFYALKKKNLDAHILLQIHDEILLTVAKGSEQEVQKLVTAELESVVDWGVKLSVDTHFGNNWKEAK